MPLEAKKIAYLFGAGATHAELVELEPNRLHQPKQGLLIGDVSSRVMEYATARETYLSGLETVSGIKGFPNVELLISLIESSKVQGWASKSQQLKEWVQRDIKAILTPARMRRFYLHKALFELHERRAVRSQEQIVGFISLNYDGVLDQAYRKYYGAPDYCFSLDEPRPTRSVPLLKLHGSFNWSAATIRGRRRTIEIIPLGSSKSYIHAPYAFIWSEALEVLIKCDTLRVVGCSLSQNDVHLIDLLFKAHLERRAPFDIEIIARDGDGEIIRNNYGFFPGIKTLVKIEAPLIPDPDPSNPFKTWIKYKSLKMLTRQAMRRTTYLRKVIS